MSLAQSVVEVLSKHVVLEVESIEDVAQRYVHRSGIDYRATPRKTRQI
jgi:hypothetical protein